jgi:diaminopimelate epimerase
MDDKSFKKYQGTGNDFILVDHRVHLWIDHKDQETIAQLCDRRFGIGADGLILLEESNQYDFKMVYFNSDGKTSSMCGNGGRCIVAFANELGIKKDEYTFEAIDGLHKAKIDGNEIQLEMNDVSEILCNGSDYILDTGSPHFVRFIKKLEVADIVKTGKNIRFSPAFAQDGINVNLAEVNGNGMSILTYERGVEDETLSCGTGVTAAALSFAVHLGLASGNHEVPIKARGGSLKVRF